MCHVNVTGRLSSPVTMVFMMIKYSMMSNLRKEGFAVRSSEGVQANAE